MVLLAALKWTSALHRTSAAAIIWKWSSLVQPITKSKETLIVMKFFIFSNFFISRIF